MKLNENYDAQIGNCCNTKASYAGEALPYSDGDLRRMEQEKERAQREYVKRECATEAVRLLGFITNPSQGNNNMLGYGPLRSELAQNICDLCIDALAESRK